MARALDPINPKFYFFQIELPDEGKTPTNFESIR